MNLPYDVILTISKFIINDAVSELNNTIWFMSVDFLCSLLYFMSLEHQNYYRFKKSIDVIDNSWFYQYEKEFT